jgi:hypothetical protein|tara:strand:- start:189 stop:431 length:243 start_codon:yes stop_codon:yes gene_type:complete
MEKLKGGKRMNWKFQELLNDYPKVYKWLMTDGNWTDENDVEIVPYIQALFEIVGEIFGDKSIIEKDNEWVIVINGKEYKE